MGASVGITVGVDGESEYSRSLKNITAETKAFQSELKALQSSFDKNASTWDKTQMTAGVLTDEIGAQYKKLDALRDAQSKVAEGSTKYFEYADKINKATDALNQMERQLESLPNHIQAIGEDFEKWGGNIENAGKKVSKVGDALMPVSTVAIGGLYKSFDAIKDYTQNVDRAWSVTGALDRSLSEAEKQQAYNTLDQEVKKYARDTVFTAEEVASALEYEGLAGWDVYDSLDALSANLDLAAASELDLSRSTDILTDTASAFNISAKDAAHIANIYAAAQANSNTTTDLLGETMGYVAGTAGGLGLSLEDIAVASGLMGNRFVKGSRAGTALNRIISNMTKPANDTAAALIDELGVGLYDAEGKTISFHDAMDNLRAVFGAIDVDASELESVFQSAGDSEEEASTAFDEYRQSLNLTMSDQERLTDIIQIFGVRALPGVLSIINATEEEYNNLTEAIYTADGAFEVNGRTVEGAAAAMAAVKNENLAGNVKLFESALYNLWITFGEKLLPTFTKAVEGATSLINKFSELDDGTQDFIIKVGLFAAAVGPVLSIGGRLITGIGTLTSGVGGLLKFVGGLVTIPAKFSSGASVVTGALGTVQGAIGAAGAASSGAGVIGSLGSLAAGFAPFLVGGAVVVGLGIGVYEIVKHWDTVKEGIGKLVGWLGEKATGLVDGIKGFFGKVGDFFTGGKDKAVAETKLMHIGVNDEVSAMERESAARVQEMQNEIALLTKALKEDTTEQFGYTRDEAVSRIIELKIESQKEMANAKSGIVGEAKDTRGQVGGEFTGMANDAHTWGSDLGKKFSEGMHSMIATVKERAINLADTVKKILGFSEPSEGPLSDFHTYAPDMMKLFASGIDDNIGVVTGKLQSLGMSMNSIFNGLKNEGFNTGVGTAGNLGSGFEQNMHRIQNAAENMKHSVMSSLVGLASAAHSWGADMANNMASGISSAMNRAASAAAALAGKLSSYLHFSEPDVGPLSDFHTYMPDMMKELAGGIYKNMGLIDRASDTLAAALLPDVGTGKIKGRSNSTSITNGDIVLNVYGAEGQDVRELAQIVEQEITFNMNRRSAAFT